MTKYVKIIFAAGALAFQSFVPVLAQDTQNTMCWKNPTFVAAMDLKKGQEILADYNKNHTKKLPENGEFLTAVYQADIKNDGKLKYIFVFVDNSGSMGAENVLILQKNGEHLDYLGDIPRPADNTHDGPFYFYRYANNTSSDEFLTQMCGNTYMVFDLGGNRDAYLWKNGKTQSACDDNWLNFERDSFQTLYKNHLYQKAYDQLNFYSKRCNASINPQTAMWIKNDLALAIQKTGDTKESLNILNSIENDPNYSSASTALKKAVAFNKNKCASDLAMPAKLEKPMGDKEYAWLLNKKLSEQEKNKLFSTLILQAAPGGKPSKLFDKVGGLDFLNYPFGSALAQTTYPPDMLDGRYGIASGFVPHDAGWRGILWVDIHEGTSVVGFVADHSLAITSKYYNATTIPPRAKQDIKKIAQEIFDNWDGILKNDSNYPATREVFFYDIEKKETQKFPFSWLGS